MPGANKSRLPKLDGGMLTEITRVSANTAGDNHYEKGKYARPTVRSSIRSIMKVSAKPNAEMMRNIKQEEYIDEIDPDTVYRGFKGEAIATITNPVACEVTNDDRCILLSCFQNQVDNTKYVVRIYIVNSDGSYSFFTKQSLSTNKTSDLALNINSGTVYTAEPELKPQGKVSYIRPGGVQQYLTDLPATTKPEFIAVDNANNDVYVIDTYGNKLYKYLNGYEDPTLVATISSGATGIVVSDAIYISYPTNIVKVTKQGYVSTLSTGFTSIKDITCDCDNTLFIVDNSSIILLFTDDIKKEYPTYKNSIRKIVDLPSLDGISAIRNDRNKIYTFAKNSPLLLRLKYQ